MDAGAALRFTHLHGSGLGLDENGSASESVASLGPRGHASFRIAGPLRLVAGLGLDVPFTRYRFVYLSADGTTVAAYRMAPVTGQAYVGIGVLL